MEKILSVVVPTYNMEKYLDRSLTSLILPDEQMDQLEVLVINDGSKDRSSEIAHSYEARYPQTFRVVDKENGNYGSCINAALKIANGIYIKVLDADDYFDVQNFSEYLNFLSQDRIKQNIDCIFTKVNCTSTTEESSLLFGCCRRFKEMESFPLDGIDTHAIENIQMHEVTYKVKRLKDIRYYQTERISYTDQQWTFLPMTQMQQCIYWPKIVYNYFLGRNGQTTDINVYIKNYAMELAVAEDMLKSYSSICHQLSANQANYAKVKLFVRVSKIYSDFFIRYKNELAPLRNELIKFDDSLKLIDSSIYEKTDNITYKSLFEHRVIHWWRNTYSFNNPHVKFFFLCVHLGRILKQNRK